MTRAYSSPGAGHKFQAASAGERRIVDALATGEPLHISALVVRAHLPMRNVRGEISNLLAAGTVVRTARGTYRLSDDERPVASGQKTGTRP